MSEWEKGFTNPRGGLPAILRLMSDGSVGEFGGYNWQAYSARYEYEFEKEMMSWGTGMMATRDALAIIISLLRLPVNARG